VFLFAASKQGLIQKPSFWSPRLVDLALPTHWSWSAKSWVGS